MNLYANFFFADVLLVKDDEKVCKLNLKAASECRCSATMYDLLIVG